MNKRCAIILPTQGKRSDCEADNAVSYTQEIENNIDNVEAILDAAYAHSAFTDDKILGMLLK